MVFISGGLNAFWLKPSDLFKEHCNMTYKKYSKKIYICNKDKQNYVAPASVKEFLLLSTIALEYSGEILVGLVRCVAL